MPPPLKIFQIFRGGATKIIDISILALYLLAKQLGGTMVQIRAIYQACLIIAECSPLKTVSVGHSREGLKHKLILMNDDYTKEEDASKL